MKKHKEKLLLKQFNSRDEVAFTRVYELLYNDVFYFARKLFACVFTEPEDAVHDVFLKLLESTNQFESFNSLKGYVYTALRNRLLNDIEHGKVIKKYQKDKPPVSESDFFSAMVKAEAIGLLYRSLEELPEQCGRVMKLCVKGLSNKEVAQELAISVNTVYAHKQRAMQLLKESLPNKFQ